MSDLTPSRRSSPVIELLEADKPVFSLWVNYYGVGSDYQTAVAAQDNPYFDFLLYDLEHQPYDLGLLKRFLWDLLDPAALVTTGRGVIKPVIPRLPPNGRELNQWVIKQVLDTGVAGIMVPHIETPEQALNVVAAARYPQKPGAPDFAPEGKRGYSPAVPARYWGLHPDDYAEHSDIWGLDPRGELLFIFIIESKAGVDNVREIARALTEADVRCILWAGGGGMSLSYGEPVYGGPQPATRAGIDAVLAAGREFGIPVGMNGLQQAEADYARSARAFFSIGPAALGGSPISAETRAALRRSAAPR